jgi:hypothetical protein
MAAYDLGSPVTVVQRLPHVDVSNVATLSFKAPQHAAVVSL